MKNDDFKQERMEILQNARRQKQLQNEEIIIQTNPIARWESSNKTSRSLAIAANCANCVGCTEKYLEPGFRQSIGNCQILNCPLHKFRPYQSRNKQNEEICK